MSVPFGAEALEEIVHDAAMRVRRDFDRRVPSVAKADGSPVTATDRAVDTFLHEALGRLVPDAAWVSEESDDATDATTRALAWIVDPIDGTGQLVRQIPELAVSVALVRGASPIAAAVVNPMTEESGLWVAGATPRFRGMSPRSAARSLEDAVATVSRNEWKSGDLAGLEDIVGATRPLGSVAYKLLRVAAGADHLTYSLRSKREWDVCAGVGLIQAVGRVYLRLDGQPVRFDRTRGEMPSGAVAGAEPLARALRDRLLERLARRP